jgi:N-acetylmuramoyl-L-alanine amidase
MSNAYSAPLIVLNLINTIAAKLTFAKQLSERNTVKKQLLFGLIILLFTSGSSPVVELQKNKLDVIVIDAGHGGKDPGCIGVDKTTYEKDVALAIALKLGAMLEDSLKDVKVIFTRDTDRFVPLWKRAEIANKNDADLFISIHCNANRSHLPKGTETYVMGIHKNKGNFEVSKRENQSILLEQDHKKSYDDFDPNSDESYILLSLMQNAFRRQSLELAGRIQKKIEENKIRKNLGVKEAGFVVLWKTTMPSILVETGFLTNTDDKDYLTSVEGKNNLAESIFHSVKELKIKLEK